MTKKVRIIERTSPCGVTTYVIQQKHHLFRWVWVDAWVNSFLTTACRDSFHTLKEAQDNLCRFDGSPTIETVVQ